MMTRIPIATATDVRPNRTYPDAYIVTVKCPYCPASHSHGITELTSDGGHRTAHCLDQHVHTPNSAGYFIHIPQAVLQEVQ